MKELFDALSGTEPAGAGVWTLLALVAAVELASEPLSLAWIYSHLCFENVLELLVRRNLFSGALSGGLLSVGVGDAAARFRDDVDGAIAPINEWYRLTGEGVFTVVALVVMLRVDPVITLLALLPTGIVVVLLNRARSRLHRYTMEARRAASTVSGFLGDSLQSALATKAVAAEDRVVSHFERLGDRRRRAALQATVFNELLASSSGNVSLLARAAVLLLATASLRRGDFTVGDFALFSLYMEWVFEFPRRIGRALASHRVSAVSTERLTTMVAGSSERSLVGHYPVDPGRVARAATALDPKDELRTLSLKGLTSRHANAGRGVEDVSFRLERGSVVVVTGPMGSGKTTLLKAVLGLAPHHGGEVTWNEESVGHLHAPRVAYVPQVPVLFTGSLADNLLLGLEPDPERWKASIERAALDDDLARLDAGLDTIVGPRGTRLSGGQILRAATARALLRDPELLVLDDVSSALDVDTERELWRRLLDRGDLSILAVSTRRHVLSLADQVVVLDEGRVVGIGAPMQLLRDCALLARIWENG